MARKRKKKDPPAVAAAKQNLDTLLVAVQVTFQTAARVVIVEGDVSPYPETKKLAEKLIQEKLAANGGKPNVEAVGFKLWPKDSAEPIGNGQDPTSNGE